MDIRNRNKLVLEDLLTKTTSEVAKKYNLSVRQVRRIRKNGIKNLEPQNNLKPHNPLLRSDVLKILKKRKKKGAALDYIAKEINISTEKAREVIEHLAKHDGYNIVPVGKTNIFKLTDVISPQNPLNIEILEGKPYSFGVLSDTHMCSKYCREDVLNAAYDMFEKRGIKKVIHAGNIIDGEFKYNMYELLAHGLHEQAIYLADNYPKRKGITTYFISGECHEGWWQSREGINVGWYLENWCKQQGRNDLVHIGHVEQDIILNQPQGKTRIRVIHPGGGTAYALSYSSQKMVESFQGGEKPHVMIMGHYHKFDMNYVREVVCLQPGCIQDQTTFMRKKKIGAHVGFCILTIGSRLDGTIGRANVEWFPFYDRQYHMNLNEYSL